MSSVLEITAAIRELPKEEFWNLAEWFDEIKAAAWDAEIQGDAQSGKLDALFAEADAGLANGTTKAWPKARP